MRKLFFTLCFCFLASLCFAEGNVTPEWRDAGFTDYDASGWMAGGFTLDEAKAWQAAGFAPGVAANWHKKRISPDDAGKWKAAGIKDSKRAGKLVKAGLTPETYKAVNPSGALSDEEIMQKVEQGK